MTANKNNNLDATDWKILAELQRDARSSYKEIGEAVGMTRPAVRERILRMEESGVVTVRDRDTMQQDKVHVDDLVSYIEKKIAY